MFLDAVRTLGINNATTHDLRRTALTNMVSLGDIAIAERIANHAPPGQQRRYFVGDMIEEKGELLELWADRLSGVV
jgi:integrase